MRGENTKSDEGHAWVCDGYKYSIPKSEYALYVIPDWSNPVTELEEITNDIVYNTSYVINYHMNWGWGDGQDGYYVEITKSMREPLSNYSDRKELLISK